VARILGRPAEAWLASLLFPVNPIRRKRCSGNFTSEISELRLELAHLGDTLGLGQGYDTDVTNILGGGAVNALSLPQQ
jgi:hypothetical protein